MDSERREELDEREARALDYSRRVRQRRRLSRWLRGLAWAALVLAIGLALALGAR